MAQSSLTIGDAAGAVVRANINAAIEAIITQNSGATEPTTTYPNMWWYDTSTALLKRRNNANDAWIVLGLEAADTDGTLAANSDAKVATQKATKTYVDAKTIAENRLSLSDNTTANASTSAHGLLKKLSNVATEFMNGVGNWVAVTIDALLPAQTDANGKFLTSNGTNASWGSPLPAYTSGTYLDGGIAATERTISANSSYAKIKELYPVLRSGTVSVSMEIKGQYGDHAAARISIFKNGSLVGTERAVTASYVVHAEDIAVSVGDVIQVYGKDNQNGTQYVKNLKILCSNPTVPNEAL
jgi:hypothetical protein